MKIFLIRHAKVQYSWQKKYSSSSFNKACKEYDSASIVKISNDKVENINAIVGKNFEILTSELFRTKDTAKQLFGNTKFVSSILLNEIPLLSYCTTEKEKSTWKWKIFGRLQWLLGNKKQKSKEIIIKEIKNIIEYICKSKINKVVIGHGFYFLILIKELRKIGWKVNSVGRMKNLDIVICKKEDA